MPSAAMKVALTFTAVDAASGAMRLLERRLVGMGSAAQRLQKDFDAMISHFQAGVKSLSAAWYLGQKLEHGVRVTGNLQEAMLYLKTTLMQTHQNMATLNEELQRYREITAKLQVPFPYGQIEFVNAARMLLRHGLSTKDVLAPHGALWSVGALASQSNLPLPETAQQMGKLAAMYGVKGPQFYQMADWMQRISETSPMIHLQDMVAALGYARRTGALFHIPFKEALTAVAAVSAYTADPSTAGMELDALQRGLLGATKKQREGMIEAGLNFWKDGKFIGLEGIIKKMQAFSAKPQTEHQKAIEAYKMFGVRGLGAFTALMQTGPYSYEMIKKRAQESASLIDKLTTVMTGLNRNLAALQGTSRTLVADAFNPMLPAATAVVKGFNAAAEAADQFAVRHKAITKGMDYSLTGAAGLLAGYGAWRLLRGGAAGLRVLKGLKGTALGVVEGKALQKTAGVTPVFVVGGRLDGKQWGGAGGEKTTILDQYGRPILRNAAPAVASAAGMVGLSAAWTTAAILPPALLGAAGISAAMYIAKNNPKWARGWDWGQSSAAAKNYYAHQDAQMQAVEAKLDQYFRRPHKNNITVNLTVDGDGRVGAVSKDPNTRVKINLKRGKFIF